MFTRINTGYLNKKGYRFINSRFSGNGYLKSSKNLIGLYNLFVSVTSTLPNFFIKLKLFSISLHLFLSAFMSMKFMNVNISDNFPVKVFAQADGLLFAFLPVQQFFSLCGSRLTRSKTIHHTRLKVKVMTNTM